jgi:peroxiredoxin
MRRLQVGDTVQDFTLPTSMGTPVALSEALRSGPVVLAWYLFDFGRV